LEPLTTADVGQGAAKRTVTAYVILGLVNAPLPVWVDEKGRFFALDAGTTGRQRRLGPAEAGGIKGAWAVILFIPFFHAENTAIGRRILSGHVKPPDKEPSHAVGRTAGRNVDQSRLWHPFRINNLQDASAVILLYVLENNELRMFPPA
jgi:hypothetical protein